MKLKSKDQEVKTSRCVIISGSSIKNYDKVKTFLKDDDYFVFADSGLYHKEKLGVRADLIIGDFDSYKDNPKKMCKSDEQIISLPSEKDDTDTFYAVKECIKRGFKEFLLIGAIGKRIDHSFANISALIFIAQNNLKALAIDDYSAMRVIISGQKATIDENCNYFSTISLSQKCTGVIITNAKYPLSDATIEFSYQYGISNENAHGKAAEVSIKSGTMLIVEVYSD